jgi:hypothetical protein
MRKVEKIAKSGMGIQGGVEKYSEKSAIDGSTWYGETRNFILIDMVIIY